LERPNEDCVSGLPKAALALLREKDAEIERLKHQISVYHKMIDICESKYEMLDFLTKKARAEAITEFSERMEKSLTAQVNVSSNEMLAAFMWCLDLVKNVEKQLKGETDGKSDL
jgi:hypothetical protein